MSKHKKKHRVVLVLEELCRGCRACTESCRHEAIRLADSGGGVKRAVLKHPDRCTACGRCVKACPEGALKLEKKQKD